MINGNLFENCTPKLTKHFPGSQTSDNLASALGQTVVKWKLTRTRCGPAIYTDNTSNIAKAVTDAGYSLHVGCFAHTLKVVRHI